MGRLWTLRSRVCLYSAHSLVSPVLVYPIGMELTRIGRPADHTGVTPLICAVQSGKAEVVKLLLDRGELSSLHRRAASLTDRVMRVRRC